MYTHLYTLNNNDPLQVVFAQNSNRGHIYDVEGYDDAPAKGLVDVQCFPLYSFLLALNVTTVDYFSLDVEGAEYKVLQTIPWDKVDIKVRGQSTKCCRPFPETRWSERAEYKVLQTITC